MAGDWIKMRSELWTHPKFICLSNTLIYNDKESGFAAYVLSEDSLIPSYPKSNENVTDIMLRTVTRRVLRDVTMCSLLRVWCAVNAHAKVSEGDAICHPMNLSDLDEIAGFDGFGDALAISGWVVHDEGRDSLIFKNFLEFNEPACMRKKPAKTGAERAAEFRARKKEKECVTKSNESNAREEKRRIKNTQTVFPAPKGVDQDIWDSWLLVRKSKKATAMSDHVIAGINREAAKAGIDLNAAILKCVEKNWISFDADWVNKNQSFSAKPVNDPFEGAI